MAVIFGALFFERGQYDDYVQGATIGDTDKNYYVCKCTQGLQGRFCVGKYVWMWILYLKLTFGVLVDIQILFCLFVFIRQKQ